MCSAAAEAATEISHFRMISLHGQWPAKENRSNVSHEEAMLVVCCLFTLRTSNDFHMFCETAEQEQQLASFSSQLAFQYLMLVSIVHMVS